MDHSTIEAERFRIFINHVKDYAIFMLTPEGIVSSWNAGAERFKGYRPEEIIGQHFSVFYAPEDRASGLPERALKTARESGRFEQESWRIRKDGTPFWASVVIDPVYAPEGELLGFTKITRDITDKRDAADKLHASEEQFRLLVESVSDYAIYMLSPEGMITNWNEGARRIKKLGFDEVKGTHFSRFYTPEDRAAGLPARALATASREGRFESEGWRVRGDGGRFWAHVLIDPVRDAKGALIGFAKITRDITEKREAALAMEKARDVLMQAQKMEAIGKLTGGIAHDFNNLLSVIGNGMALLRTSVDPATQRKALDSMERAAQRGKTLTQQLLAFARQQALQLEKHDVNRILSSFEAVLRRAVPSATTIIFDRSPVARVLTDLAQFEACLLNLVINARDACSGAADIVIRTCMRELRDGEVEALGAGQYVVISVHDKGAGMSPEIKARAFEPFFTTKDVGKGTGLGLSQVYGLMQQSRGGVTIDSDIGQGTSVSLYFPAVEREAIDEAQFEEEPAATKVLIVDDEADVLDTAVALFQNLGYEVLAANGGKEALLLIEQNPDITILFSDVVMPGLDGVALARAAKHRNPGLKIILTSGYMQGKVIEDVGPQIKEFNLIAKPYHFADLLHVLHEQEEVS